MGAIISPTFGIDKYADLPYACSLNGSCSTVCPVKIDIKDQIYKWRRVIAEDENMFPASRKLAMAGADYLLSSPKLFHGTIELTKKALTTLPDSLMYTSLNAYGKDRKMPPGSEESFSDWYKKRKK
jgi:L-lactate dehydrogenase complex protein LldF